MTKSYQFQFDRKLWLRLIKIAQPYFFPVAPRQTQVFFCLVLVLLLAIIAIIFFLTIGLIFLAEAIFPNFFSQSASELIDQVHNLLNSPIAYIAVGTLFVSSLIFRSQKHKLKKRWAQWSLSGLLLFLLFATTGIKVLISYALRLITTALNQRNEEVFWQNLTFLGIIFIIAIPIFVIYNYSQNKLGLMWREWLAKSFLNLYFYQRNYYKLNNSINLELDNPDQRITEDIDSFTTVTLNLLLQLLSSIITLFSFVTVLYSISKILALGLLIYAISGTFIALIMGSRVIGVNYNQFRLEANFRYSLIRVRENAESVAFYRGEKLENQQVNHRLIDAIKNFNLLIIWESFINLFQKTYEYIILLFPFFIIAPLYFKGEVEFGQFTQADYAFAALFFALAFVVNQLQKITGYAASINRLAEFHESCNNLDRLSEIDEEFSLEITHIDYQNYSQINLQNLTLKTPDFLRILIKDLSVSVSSFNNLLVMGSSGLGKSSLLRAIAQLWTSGKGTIKHPQLEEMLFLPQRPYMIVGTLREQLLYPNLTNTVDDDQLQLILEKVNLPNLISRFKGGLNAQENWEKILSLGEQQRVAFARILVSKPLYVILDEATSALDVDNEKALYQTLLNGGTTYISVGHRNTLKQYHQQLLKITEGGEWELKEINN